MMYKPEDDDTERLIGSAMVPNLRKVFYAIKELNDLGDPATLKMMIPHTDLSESTISKYAIEMCKLHVAKRDKFEKDGARSYIYSLIEGPILDKLSQFIAEYDDK